MLVALLTNNGKKLAADYELMAAIAQKDQQALEKLYDRYSKLLYTLILRIVRSTTEAEDVLQEVFLQVWNKAELYSSLRRNLLTWLVTLSRNRAIDQLRSKSHRQQKLRSPEEEMFALSDQTTRANPLLVLEVEEIGKILRSTLRKLSKSKRTIIELAYYDGLSQSEIAEKLGTPLGTVKTRMRTAMMTLRESLAKHQK